MSGLKKLALALETDPEAADYLRRLSKAALLDVVIDLVRQDGHASCDDVVSVERVRAAVEPVLARRGDRLPAPAREGAGP